jgi:hypothetical protein
VTHLEPPPVGPAIEVEATRRNLRRYLRIARLATTVAGLLMITSAVLFLVHVSSLDLQTDGARSIGTVEAISAHQVGNPRIQTTFVLVTYTGSGRNIHERISLGRPTKRFRDGQQVTIRYDSAHPTLAEVQGYPSHAGVPPVVPLLLGVIVLAFSWPGIRRAHLVQRVLSNDPWDAHHSELVEVPLAGPMVGLSNRARILLRLEGMTGVVVTAPVGIRRLNPTFAPVAWVAGYGDRLMVVAPPGGSPIVCVRAVGKTV